MAPILYHHIMLSVKQKISSYILTCSGHYIYPQYKIIDGNRPILSCSSLFFQAISGDADRVVKASSNTGSDSLSNAELTFCRLVFNGTPESEAYCLTHNCNDLDYAERQIPLLLRRVNIKCELSRLKALSPDELLRDDCQRLLADPTLKAHERLKLIQTLDKVQQRLADNRREDNVSDSLRAWIAEGLQGAPGPMAES